MQEWEIVNKEIDRSKIIRVDWKAIFNMTLTKKIRTYYKLGMTSRQAFETILSELKSKGYLPEHCPELYRRIRISVAARYGEMKGF